LMQDFAFGYPPISLSGICRFHCIRMIDSIFAKHPIFGLWLFPSLPDELSESVI
jgi:hypothetical protein